MPRRLYSLGFLGFCAVLSLVSCRAALPRPVPPEEAVRRMLVRNALLDSVSFDTDLRLDSSALSGSLALTGSLLRGGAEFAAAGTISIEKPQVGRWISLTGPISFVSDGDGTIAFRTQGLTGELADSLHRSFVGGIDGRWWNLSSGTGARTEQSESSPDAAQINALVSAVNVIKGSDILRAEDGEYEYRITVGLSSGSSLVQRERLGETDINGELWIDARSFVLRRVRWNVKNIELPLAPGNIVFDVRFSKFDRAPHPKTNAPSVQTISAKSLLDTILRKPLVP